MLNECVYYIPERKNFFLNEYPTFIREIENISGNNAKNIINFIVVLEKYNNL